MMILRDAPGSSALEVFVQQRQSTMTYAAHMTVFPGGGLEDCDADPQIAYFNHPAAHALGLSAPDYAAATQAARRELVEEAGVTLDPTHPIMPVDRWITPAHDGFARRYDTTTFITTLPDSVMPQHQTTEATHSYWATPGDLLQRWSNYDIALMVPTWYHLSQLAAYTSIDEALQSYPRTHHHQVFVDWYAPDVVAPYFHRATITGAPRIHSAA